MPLSRFPDLQKLPKRQKLKLADELWRAAMGDATPVTAEQRRLLGQRWADYRAGNVKRIGLAELERRLARR